jgi:hypothetical protein
MPVKRLYKIIFMTQGQVYEIYAREVGHGTLFGFIEVEKLVFGERSSVVVDPSEEKIQSEFAGVKRTYLPMHSIIRIDEVDKQGTSKISKLEGGNVSPFPVPVYTPGGGSSNKPEVHCRASRSAAADLCRGLRRGPLHKSWAAAP